MNDSGLDSRRQSITERASSESTSLERKSAPPPPVVGTEVRAFNATAMLPPNPTATGSVIRQCAPVKSHFSSFILKIGEKYKPVQCGRRNIPSRHPSRRSRSALYITNPPEPPDPRTGMLLPRKGSSNRGQRFNHSRHDDCHDVRACSCPSKYQTMYRR